MFGVLATVLLLSGQASQPSPDCLDDRLVDRCDQVRQQATRDRLGLASIEEEAEAGAEVIRVLYVDGYGNDLPALSFERRPGEGPQVRLYGAEGRTMSAPMSAEAWAEVRARARFADRALVPTGVGAEAAAELAICLHSWVVTVEMTGTDTAGRSEPVRRRTEDSCSSGLTTSFAFEAAGLALKAATPCSGLDIARQRNSVTLLATCLQLEGDRLAAATVFNEKRDGKPRYGLDPLDAGAWRAFLGTNGSPTLVWADQTVGTNRGSNNRVAEFVVARLRETPGLEFSPRRYRGVSAQRVEVEGLASLRVQDGEVEIVMSANYLQTWIWDPNLQEFMLDRWTVPALTKAP